MTSTIYFIGAGPGDPDLITIKGHRIIAMADVIIYAGSLVNPQVFAHCRSTASIHNSAMMDLSAIIAVMQEAHQKGLMVARVHTGDPSIYGSIREQIEELDKLHITYEVIPGVSSFTAAASVLAKEFTVPEISQTVICTRFEGRTPVPELERIDLLASHQTSMAIFLSVHMMTDLVTQLTRHYKPSTPVAVIEKATWPDQRVVRGTLADIAQQVSAADIRKTAMILVGDFLGDDYHNSKLYDTHFTHEYRKGSSTCGE
jgi:precorrin-4/cobalt-precorrin-4 C11-methyltransferase